jgi:Uma2 family endonuclease
MGESSLQATPMSSILPTSATNVGEFTPAAAPAVPPLENGDHLNRAEFMRRYEAMPEGIRAELIGGIVFMAAALRHRQHGGPHGKLGRWLGHYIDSTPGLDGGLNATTGLDEDNAVEPDLYLLIPKEAGGRCTITEDGYLEGPPALVAEISASSTSIDLNRKFKTYRESGVSEYIVWRVQQRTVDWFVLEQGDYRPLANSDGIFRSRICPGLWLDPAALIRRKMRRVIEVLDQGMATAEYRAFAQLVARYAPPEEP